MCRMGSGKKILSGFFLFLLLSNQSAFATKTSPEVDIDLSLITSDCMPLSVPAETTQPVGNTDDVAIQSCGGGGGGGGGAPAPTPPAVPAAPTGTVSSNSITVRWNAVTGATSYRVQQRVNSGSWQTEINTGTAVSRVYSSLGAGTYQYRVRACNNSTCSAYSAISSGLSILAIPPVPRVPTVTLASATGINVNWGTASPPIDPCEAYGDCCDRVTGICYEIKSPGTVESTGAVEVQSTGTVTYRVQQRLGSGSWQAEINTGTAASRAFTSLAAGSYTYQVRACNANGQCSAYSAASSSISIVAPPAVPAGLSASQSGLVINTAWNAVSGATSYRIRQSVNGNWQTEINRGTILNHSFSVAGGSSYQYQVRACNNGGCSAWSTATTTITTPAIPAIPAGISASLSGLSISVSWNASTGASSYNLRQSLNGSWGTAVSKGTTRTHSVTATPGSRYQYQIQACNASGCSGWSTATALITPPVVPAAPPTPSVALQTATSILVNWGSSTPPIDPCHMTGTCHCNQFEPCMPLGEPAPEVMQLTDDSMLATTQSTGNSYYVQQRLGSGTWQTAVNRGTATSHTYTGLVAGSYTYRVQTCNSSGCSAWSGVSSAVTIVAPPAVPTGLSAIQNLLTINTSWNAVTGATSYRIRQSTNASWQTEINKNTALSHTFSVSAAVNYQYQVRACNAGGCSDWSSATAAIMPLSIPLVPAALTAALDGTTINTGWNASTNATAYYIRESRNGSWQAEINKGSARSHSFTVTPGSSYQYQVRACGTSGCSGWSVATSTVTPPALPGIPPTPSASQNGTNILVNWGSSTPPIDPCHMTGTCHCNEYGPCMPLSEPVPETMQIREDAGLVTIQSSGLTYRVQGYKEGVAWGAELINLSGTSSSLPWTQAGNYTFKVRACNSSGCSGWSGTSSAVNIVAAPAVPTGLKATQSLLTINTSWNTATGATSYRIRQSINGSWQTEINKNLVLSHTFSVSAAVNYQHQVRACNAGGCSDWSAVTAPIMPLSIPLIPSALTAKLEGTTINTSWNASTNATAYYIRESRNGSLQTEINKGSARSHSFTVTPGSSYQYQVRACGTSGCSGWSALTAPVTPPALPGIPPTPSASQSGNNILVSWGSSTPPIDPCHMTGTCHCNEYSPCIPLSEPVPESMQIREDAGLVTTQSSGLTYRVQGYKEGVAWGAELLNISGTSSSLPWTQAGSYTFKVRACNSSGCSGYTVLSNAVIISQAVAPVATPNGGSHNSQVNVTLSTTTTGAIIRYTLNNSAVTASSAQYTAAIPISQSTTLRAKAFKVGMADSSELVKSFTILQPAATPNINPNGGTHTNSVSVSLASTTNDATLRYTTDNSAVTATSAAYSGPFTLTGNATVRAKAFKSGMAESSESTATFTVLQQVATPSITPDGGNHASSVTVSLQSATNGAVLRYTTNNTTVTASSTAYTSPLTFTANVTLRVKAFKNGMADSAERSASFTILQPAKAPTITPDGGKHAGSVSVSLITATQGASIRYTIDNSAVSESSALYSAPIKLNNTATIKAKSFKSGMAESIETSATFTITEFPEANTPPEPLLREVPIVPEDGRHQGMRLSGQFDVTSSGQATYSIPILAARGTAGLQPDFRLNYSSGAGNGVLGLGWSLSGTGAITRCRQTYASERNALPVTLSADDRFCLNGQRLLLISSGQYGAVGSIYKLEIDNYSKITAVGGSLGHPDSFRVDYKDGTWETYGNTLDSVNSRYQLQGSPHAITWALSKRSDSAANKIIYSYVSDNTGHRIDTAQFAYGIGNTHNAYIKFDYQVRSDPISGFIAGYPYRTGVRLSRITSYSGNSELRQYNLTYNTGSANSPNNKLSRLSRIQECTNSRCTQPTDFEWSLPTTEFSSSAVTMPYTGGMSNFALGDIDGDGLLDIAWLEQAETADLHNNIKPRAYRYALAENHNGQFQWRDAFKSQSIFTGQQIHLVDTNNDGRMEVLAGHDDKLTSTMFIDLNGDGMVERLSSQYQRPWVNYYWSGAAGVLLAQADETKSKTDENYFGLKAHTPLRQVFSSSSHIPSYNDAMTALPTTYYLRRNNAGVVIQNDLHLSPIHSLTGLTGDVDGDGRMDIVAYAWTSHGQCYQDNDFDHCEWENSAPVLYSVNEPLPGHFELSYKEGFTTLPDPGYAFMVDLNGDGLSDLVYARGHDDWAFRLSNGVSFENPVAINIPGRPFFTHNRGNTDVAIADINGDGYPDIIWHSPNQPFNNKSTGSGSGSIRVKYWDPVLNRFSDQEEVIRQQGYTVMTNYSDARFGWDFRFNRFKTNAIQMADVNGDGKPDLLITSTTQSGGGGVYLSLASPQAENTITAIHRGRGDSIEIEYDILSQSSYYARGDVVSSYATELCTSISDSYGSYNKRMCWEAVAGEKNTADFYRNLNDPWHKLPAQQQSLKPEEPVFSKAGPMTVVTGVSISVPTSNDSNSRYNLAYFYEQFRMQASGRGFLGFEYFTVVDKETGIRTRKQFRQDWPYSGKLLKEETFSAEGHLLNSAETTYGIAQCYSNGFPVNSCISNFSNLLADNGSASLGAISIIEVGYKERRWALANNGASQGSLLSERTVSREFDTKGNIVQEQTTVLNGFGGIEQSQSIERAFSYSGSTWSMQQGRISRIEVTDTNSHGSKKNISAFSYYSSGASIGLLQNEITAPDNLNEGVTKNYSYSNGNLIRTEVTGDGPARINEVRYDTFGQHINERYEQFSDGAGGYALRLVYKVQDRDRYGQPVKEYIYTDSNSYITKLTGTTHLGLVYFTSESTGNYTVFDGGLSNTIGLCPATTDRWQRRVDATGNKIVECFNLSGQLLRESREGFLANSWYTTDYELDKRGLVVRSSTPYIFNQQFLSWISHQYDVLGRVTHTQASYNNGVLTNTAIDYDGYQTITTNALSQRRISTKNALGQLVQATDPDNGTISYQYDARGNLVEIADPSGNITQLEYDQFDRKISMSDPNKGTWWYRYNRFNELICQQDANGQIVIQQYDVRGRITSRIDHHAGGTCSAPSGAVEKFSRWEFDTAAYGLGKLYRMYDSIAINGNTQFQQHYSYDMYGRISTTRTTMPGHQNVISEHYEKVTYDQFGRPYQHFDAARSTDDFNVNGVEYRYSNSGYLTGILDSVYRNGFQQVFYSVREMDAWGNTTSADYANGVTVNQRYFRDSSLLEQSTAYAITGGSLPLQQVELIWDEVGNLQSRHETGSGGELQRRNIKESFNYDNLNQLIGWQTSGPFSLAESATINSSGNITSKTGIGSYTYGSSCTHSSNAGPHAVCRAGNTTYQYDNNGNMVSDSSGRSMLYTVHDQLRQVTKGNHTTQFSYSPEGQRYKRVDRQGSEVTTTLYLGHVEKIYYPDSSVEWRRDIAGIGIFSQRFNASGALQEERQRYRIADHLNSVSLITDEIGVVEQTHYFDPWGQARKIVTNGQLKQFISDAPFKIGLNPITRRGFTGHEQLDEVGLIHMNGRVYDAGLGRFIQADPFVQDPTKVQSLNRYSYVWNNPLNATDPSGFVCEGQACMDTRPQDNKPKKEDKPKEGSVERITVTVPQQTSHQRAMDRHMAHMVMKGASENATSSNSQTNYSGLQNDIRYQAHYGIVSSTYKVLGSNGLNDSTVSAGWGDVIFDENGNPIQIGITCDISCRKAAADYSKFTADDIAMSVMRTSYLRSQRDTAELLSYQFSAFSVGGYVGTRSVIAYANFSKLPAQVRNACFGLTMECLSIANGAKRVESLVSKPKQSDAGWVYDKLRSKDRMRVPAAGKPKYPVDKSGQPLIFRDLP